MKHLAVFLPCLFAFAALALATERQQDELFGRPLDSRITLALRAAAVLLLLFALAAAVSLQGWALGLVSYSGHTSFSAGLVFGGLIVWSRRAGRSPDR